MAVRFFGGRVLSPALSRKRKANELTVSSRPANTDAAFTVLVISSYKPMSACWPHMKAFAQVKKPSTVIRKHTFMSKCSCLHTYTLVLWILSSFARQRAAIC